MSVDGVHSLQAAKAPPADDWAAWQPATRLTGNSESNWDFARTVSDRRERSLSFAVDYERSGITKERCLRLCQGLM